MKLVNILHGVKYMAISANGKVSDIKGGRASYIESVWECNHCVSRFSWDMDRAVFLFEEEELCKECGKRWFNPDDLIKACKCPINNTGKTQLISVPMGTVFVFKEQKI